MPKLLEERDIVIKWDGVHVPPKLIVAGMKAIKELELRGGYFDMHINSLISIAVIRAVLEEQERVGKY